MQDKILHVAMNIGETIVYGSDASPAYYKSPCGLNISVNIETIGESERIFAELSDGAQTDRFGVPWMINCEKPMN